MDNVKNKKDLFTNIAKIIVIVLFIIIEVYVAKFHEPWSDEAQSFLIARDNSFSEILYYAKYEGTTPLWFFLIKIFIMCGGTYDTYFLLPLLISTIGLIIFEFKVITPWYIKILFPFTYFILYQYTIIARCYCMVLPALMWLASIYQKKDEKAVQYILSVSILMNICSYTWLIAFSLFVIDILSIVEKRDFSKKRVITILIIIIELFGSLILILPNSDCNFFPNKTRNLFDLIYQSTIGSREYSLITSIVVTVLFFLFVLIAFIKSEKMHHKIIELIIIFFPILMENILITSQIWHIGIVSILIFAVFIFYDMINDSIIIKTMSVIICLTQIIWSICSINYDIKNNYSASKDVANFLKQNNYENVNGLGFDITAIQPYFDKNIFKNQRTEKSFWLWKYNNGYIEDDSLLEDENAIFVISDYYLDRYMDIYNKLKENGYKEHYFTGELFTKTYRYESKGYYVLVK